MAPIQWAVLGRRRLRAATCLFASALTTSVLANPGEEAAFDVYGKLYPEWRVDQYGAPSNAGTRVGQLGTLRNDTTTLLKDPSPKAVASDHDWSNSYIGVRGAVRQGEWRLGYDLQGLVDLQGSVADNFRARDAYASLAHPRLGTVYAGQMDSIYKQYGDRVRMLGVSSGNFVSTSRVLSGVSWRGQGETTFHNRRGHMVTWQSPVWNGSQLGASHSFNAGARVPGSDDTLSALGLRWRQGRWYAALATEVHRNWRPMSLDGPGALPGATSVLNSPLSTRSRDQAWRLSGAWTPERWRFAVDLARLKYTENDPADLPGKFRRYATTTWQFSAEHRLDDGWLLSVNHARGAAGSCVLTGGTACVTSGLGGHLTSVGVLRELTRELGVFLLAQHVHNAPGARFASAPSGSSVTTVAAGLKYEFR